MFKSLITKRSFATSSRLLKELPKPSENYLSQRGEQPTPLTADELRSQEVKEIDLPQATIDEKILIKNAMKKRSLRMTFLQLFLITLLSSSTLNVMRQKNEMEELEENYQKNFQWLRDLIERADKGDIVMEDIRDQLNAWNVRFEALGLPPIQINGPENINKDELKKILSKNLNQLPAKEQGDNKKQTTINDISNEKLDRFL